MQSIDRQYATPKNHWLFLCLLCLSLPLFALESDRQESLEVSANSTDGTLGDGVTTLRGNVDIRQGTLHITADEAEVNKIDGRVSSVTLRGTPASLEQEIEEQGLVQATANVIDYQVASGLVTLKGDADVRHPQHQISGELLTYDLNIQHFKGNSDENGNGRIRIRMDPEVFDNVDGLNEKKNKDEGEGELAAPQTPEADPESSNKDNN
ncbi:MAG: lipopolysaccharide transport periplasmic protein LptA [Gammaproteobacteria bacterium]|nr:lipopolysaccharide transport periplasmic protein LptA [Gammaproteobacteria bacterium]